MLDLRLFPSVELEGERAEWGPKISPGDSSQMPGSTGWLRVEKPGHWSKSAVPWINPLSV